MRAHHKQKAADDRDSWLARGAIGPHTCEFENSYEALDFAWKLFGARHLSAGQHSDAAKLVVKFSIKNFLKEYANDK